MSIDRRLREGLEANTTMLLPQVDHELGVVLRRAGRRRRARLGFAGLTTAVAFVVGGWLAGSTNVLRGDGVPPSDGTDGTTAPVPMANYEGSIVPGTYAVPIWGDPEADTLPQAVVDVPAGYFTGGGWVIQTEAADTKPGHLSYWIAEKLINDPCTARRRDTSPLGPGVSDLVQALRREPLLHTSKPETVTIGGHGGVFLTIRPAADADIAECHPNLEVSDSGIALWTAAGFHFGLDAAGPPVRLWILDVDGQRIIMSVTVEPDQAPGHNTELITMALGTHFIEPPQQ